MKKSPMNPMKLMWIFVVAACIGCGSKNTATRPESYPAAPKGDQLSVDGPGTKGGEKMKVPN